MAQRKKPVYKKKKVIPRYTYDSHTDKRAGKYKKTWIREGWCDCAEKIDGYKEYKDIMELVMKVARCSCGIRDRHSHCAYCSRLLKWD